MQHAKKLGVSVKETEIRVEDLEEADESNTYQRHSGYSMGWSLPEEKVFQ